EAALYRRPFRRLRNAAEHVFGCQPDVRRELAALLRGWWRCILDAAAVHAIGMGGSSQHCQRERGCSWGRKGRDSDVHGTASLAIRCLVNLDKSAGGATKNGACARGQTAIVPPAQQPPDNGIFWRGFAY